MRKARLKPGGDGVRYHVMARTIHQIFLFQEAKIKEWVYKRILELASLYYVDIHALTN